jgi:hypothetical protein
MSEDDQIDQMIDKLIELGAIEVEGIDSETGEFLYKVTNKMQEINKELYDAHLNVIYGDTMYFWERGFVDIDDITSNNPLVTLTPKAFDQNAISQLPSDRIEILKSMVKAMGPIN